MARGGLIVSERGPRAGDHERATAERQAVRVKGGKPAGKGKGKPADSAGGKPGGGGGGVKRRKY